MGKQWERVSKWPEYEQELAKRYETDGVEVRITHVFPHPSGEIIFAQSGIEGPDGWTYQVLGLHLRAHDGRWTFAIFWLPDMMPAMAKAFAEVAEQFAGYDG